MFGGVIAVLGAKKWDRNIRFLKKSLQATGFQYRFFDS
jgi:hypothetical protein